MLVEIEARRQRNLRAAEQAAAAAVAGEEECESAIDAFCGFVVMTLPLKLPGQSDPRSRFLEQIHQHLDDNLFGDNGATEEEILNLTRITHAAARQACLERHHEDAETFEAGLNYLKDLCRRRKLPTPFQGGRPRSPLKQARDRLATALKAFYTDHGRCATMLEWALKKDGLDAVLQDLRAAPEKFGRLRDAGSRTRKQSKPSVRVDSVAAELTELFTRIGGADQ